MLVAWFGARAPEPRALPGSARRAGERAGAGAHCRAAAAQGHAAGGGRGGHLDRRWRGRPGRRAVRHDQRGADRIPVRPERSGQLPLLASGEETIMLPDLNRVIEQVSKEKGIDRDIIVKALEEAML